MKFTAKLTLPVLGLELVQMANRRQTYVLRVACVLIAHGIFISLLGSLLATSDPLEVIGQGHTLFIAIMALLFVGVYFMVPVLTAGAIAGERQRNTLDLLLTTGLRPSIIVMEKLLARLVPVMLFVISTVPLMAICYSFGGFNATRIAAALWLLGVSALQVGAVAMYCSVRCQKTTTAFLITMVVSFLWIGIGPLLAPGPAAPFMVRQLAFVFFLPVLIFHSGAADVLGVFLWSLPALLVSCGLLLAASRRLGREQAYRIRRAVRRMKAQPAASRRRQYDKDLESMTQPIAWLQIRRPGKIWWYALPVIFVGLVTAAGSQAAPDMFLWTATLIFLSLAVRSCSLISEERDRQTLDVLLTTRLSAGEFLIQKAAGVRRQIRHGWLCLLGFLPFCWFCAQQSRAYLAATGGGFRAAADPNLSLFNYTLGSLGAFYVFAQFVRWFGILIGLHERKLNRAMVATIILLVLWCLMPVIVLGFYAAVVGEFLQVVERRLTFPVLELSPAWLLSYSIYNRWVHGQPLIAIVSSLSLHLLLTCAMRFYCLKRAHVLLRRIGEDDSIWTMSRQRYKQIRRRMGAGRSAAVDSSDRAEQVSPS